MEILRWLLLESRLALLAVLIPTLFFLLVYWRRGGSPKVPLAGLLTALGLLVLQDWVVTPREHVDRLMRGVERDVMASRTERIAAALAPDFAAGEMDSDAFLKLVRRRFGQFEVHGLTRESFEMEAGTPDSLTLDAAYGATVSSDQYTGPFPTSWRITFRRADGGWKITGIEPTSLVHRPIRGWEPIMD